LARVESVEIRRVETQPSMLEAAPDMNGVKIMRFDVLTHGPLADV
jgi:hypothetical protein